MPRIAALRPPVPRLATALADLVAQVPAGRVTTFGALARALGDRAATVWVASHAAPLRRSLTAPWHRIVKAGGLLPDQDPKLRDAHAQILRAEGTQPIDQQVDLARYEFAAFRSPQPLLQLRKAQEQLRARQALDTWCGQPRQVGGVDVSYRGNLAVAAYTLVDVRSDELLWSTVARRPVEFPYIPGYLSFRELPVLLELLREVQRAGRLAEVLLVDGAGILHPRRMGIAAHLGTLLDWPTIGVAKSLLHGRLHGAPAGGRLVPGRYYAVTIDDEPLGWAVAPRAGDRQPLYLSPGQYVGLDTARRIVAPLLTGRRLPEPLYWADRLSRQAARDGADAEHGSPRQRSPR
ncbi:MAG: endonuclease V [Pirellulales bacterium]|nr:endonuclease V [Pirellulales bacterium]